MKRISTTTILAIAATVLLASIGGCAGAKQDQGGSMSLMERFHSGKSLIGADRTLTADSTEQNLTKDQKDARENYMRGLAYANQGRPELAFEQYSRATALDPNLTKARYERGLILLEQNMPAPALEEFKAVMAQTPDFAPGYAAAGRVYFMNGLYPEAEKLFAKAVEVDPKLLDAYDHLGAIHNYNKQYELALGTFQKALMINPNAAYLYNNLGLAYSMLGRDADAVEAFRKAVMQGAPSAKAYNNMGLALCRMGKYREGLEAFRASGGEAAGWNNLGYFFFLDGQNERAIKSFEKAIELEPTYYERAAENLKRARLAAQFAEGSANTPARPNSEDDLFTPRTPVIPSAFPAPTPLVQPAATPVSSHSHPMIREQNLAELPEPNEKAHVTAVNMNAENSETSVSVQLAAPLATQPAGQVAAQPMEPNAVRNQESPEPAVTGASAIQSLTVHQQVETIPAHQAARSAGTAASYALHISSFRTLTSAQADVQSLQKKHIDARVVAVTIPGKGNWYRVITGSFATVDEAHTALATYTGLSDVRVVNTAFFVAPDTTNTQGTVPGNSPAAIMTGSNGRSGAGPAPEKETEAAQPSSLPIPSTEPETNSAQADYTAPNLRMATALVLHP